MNEPKQACRNLASGKYFLFVEECDNEKVLLVLPTGEAKLLEASLFGDVEEINIEELLGCGLVTQHQIAGYKKFVEEDSLRLFVGIVGSFTNVVDVTKKLKIAQKSMSKVQYKFVLSRWIESIRSADTEHA